MWEEFSNGETIFNSFSLYKIYIIFSSSFACYSHNITEQNNHSHSLSLQLRWKKRRFGFRSKIWKRVLYSRLISLKSFLNIQLNTINYFPFLLLFLFIKKYFLFFRNHSIFQGRWVVLKVDGGRWCGGGRWWWGQWMFAVEVTGNREIPVETRLERRGNRYVWGTSLRR